jgi:TPR repeat protein
LQLKQDADKGNAVAQYNYVCCLKNGEGVTKDLREAARYFKMSADKSFAASQNSYAFCLKNG